MEPPPEWQVPQPSPRTAASWSCQMDWSVSLPLYAVASVSAWFDWLTSPLFAPGLRIAIGAFTLTCVVSAFAVAFWSVVLSFVPSWDCSIEGASHPQNPDPATVASWLCPTVWLVSFELPAHAEVSASLDWFTSPLFAPGLRIAIGALTLYWFVFAFAVES